MARLYGSARPAPDGADGPPRLPRQRRTASGQPGEDPTAKRRDPIWAKLALIVGALVMVGSGVVIVAPRVLAMWATSKIPRGALIPPELIGENIDGAINFLLLGMDERTGNTTEPIRADTIIIAHVPKDHQSGYLISLPRDAEVTIPPFPETNYRGGREKINAAFAAGARIGGKPDPSTPGRERGARLTMMTIDKLVPGGLTFNGAAIINFEGFRDVLKAIDGVDMCVDVQTRSIHYDKNMGYHRELKDGDPRQKVYPVGCYHLDYLSALDYARQRHVENGDYTRQRHQQQLLLAIFDKLASKETLSNLGRLSELQKAVGGLLTMDLGGTPVEDWAFTFKSLAPESVVMLKTNGGNFNSLANGNERISEDTMDLLAAVHNDTVYDFARAHPDWIAKKK